MIIVTYLWTHSPSGIKVRKGSFLLLITLSVSFLGLMVFPKPVTALEYTYDMSEPSTYGKFTADLKRFLERKCDLEEGRAVVPAEPSATWNCLEKQHFLVSFPILFSLFQTQTAGRICK